MQTRQTPSGLEGSSGRHRLHVPRGSLVYFLSDVLLPTRDLSGLGALSPVSIERVGAWSPRPDNLELS